MIAVSARRAISNAMRYFIMKAAILCHILGAVGGLKGGKNKERVPDNRLFRNNNISSV